MAIASGSAEAHHGVADADGRSPTPLSHAVFRSQRAARFCPAGRRDRRQRPRTGTDVKDGSAVFTGTDVRPPRKSRDQRQDQRLPKRHCQE